VAINQKQAPDNHSFNHTKKKMLKLCLQNLMPLECKARSSLFCSPPSRRPKTNTTGIWNIVNEVKTTALLCLQMQGLLRGRKMTLWSSSIKYRKKQKNKQQFSATCFTTAQSCSSTNGSPPPKGLQMIIPRWREDGHSTTHKWKLQNTYKRKKATKLTAEQLQMFICLKISLPERKYQMCCNG